MNIKAVKGWTNFLLLKASFFSSRLVVATTTTTGRPSSWCPYLFQMFLILIYSESRGKSSIEMWKFKSYLKLSYRRARHLKKWIHHVEFLRLCASYVKKKKICWNAKNDLKVNDIFLGFFWGRCYRKQNWYMGNHERR